jgi:hypothetical protein
MYFSFKTRLQPKYKIIDWQTFHEHHHGKEEASQKKHKNVGGVSIS